MAGHSQFKNIMHRKGAQDKKKATLFAKLAKDITVAVQVGGSSDPNSNSMLRAALKRAKEGLLPKDCINRALKKDMKQLHGKRFRFDLRSPFGVALVIYCISDNPNRIASLLRSLASKHNYAFLERNSHSFIFSSEGYIAFAGIMNFEEEEFLGAVSSFPVKDYVVKDSTVAVMCLPEALHKVRTFLEKYFKKDCDDCYVRKIVLQYQNMTIDNYTNLKEFIDCLESFSEIESVDHNGRINQ